MIADPRPQAGTTPVQHPEPWRWLELQARWSHELLRRLRPCPYRSLLVVSVSTLNESSIRGLTACQPPLLDEEFAGGGTPGLVRSSQLSIWSYPAFTDG